MNEKLTDERLKRTIACSNLLAPPAPEVVRELAEALLELREAVREAHAETPSCSCTERLMTLVDP